MFERFKGRFRKPVNAIEQTSPVSHIAFFDDETLSWIKSRLPEGTTKVQGLIRQDNKGRLILVGFYPETASSGEDKPKS